MSEEKQAAEHDEPDHARRVGVAIGYLLLVLLTALVVVGIIWAIVTIGNSVTEQVAR